MSIGDANFESMLAGVLSHDNAARKNAEAIYAQELESQPAVVVGQLLRCLASVQVSHVCFVVSVMCVVRSPAVPYGSAQQAGG